MIMQQSNNQPENNSVSMRVCDKITQKNQVCGRATWVERSNPLKPLQLAGAHKDRPSATTAIAKSKVSLSCDVTQIKPPLLLYGGETDGWDQQTLLQNCEKDKKG